jgi:hypothetical protein
VATCGSRLSEGMFLLGPELFDAWDDMDSASCRIPGICDLTRVVQYSSSRLLGLDVLRQSGALLIEGGLGKASPLTSIVLPYEQGEGGKASPLTRAWHGECGLGMDRRASDSNLSVAPRTALEPLVLRATPMAAAAPSTVDDCCCTIAPLDMAEHDYCLSYARFLLKATYRMSLSLALHRALSPLACGRRTAQLGGISHHVRSPLLLRSSRSTGSSSLTAELLWSSRTSLLSGASSLTAADPSFGLMILSARACLICRRWTARLGGSCLRTLSLSLLLCSLRAAPPLTLLPHRLASL